MPPSANGSERTDDSAIPLSPLEKISQKNGSPESTTPKRSRTKRPKTRATAPHQVIHTSGALIKTQIEEELLSIWRDSNLSFNERRAALVLYGKEAHKMFQDRRRVTVDLQGLLGNLPDHQRAMIAGSAGEITDGS